MVSQSSSLLQLLLAVIVPKPSLFLMTLIGLRSSHWEFSRMFPSGSLVVRAGL
jgi:hypothetical protein